MMICETSRGKKLPWPGSRYWRLENGSRAEIQGYPVEVLKGNICGFNVEVFQLKRTFAPCDKRLKLQV